MIPWGSNPATKIVTPYARSETIRWRGYTLIARSTRRNIGAAALFQNDWGKEPSADLVPSIPTARICRRRPGARADYGRPAQGGAAAQPRRAGTLAPTGSALGARGIDTRHDDGAGRAAGRGLRSQRWKDYFRPALFCECLDRAGADLRIFDGQCGRRQNGPALKRNGCVDVVGRFSSMARRSRSSSAPKGEAQVRPTPIEERTTLELANLHRLGRRPRRL